MSDCTADYRRKQSADVSFADGINHKTQTKKYNCDKFKTYKPECKQHLKYWKSISDVFQVFKGNLLYYYDILSVGFVIIFKRPLVSGILELHNLMTIEKKTYKNAVFYQFNFTIMAVYFTNKKFCLRSKIKRK